MLSGCILLLILPTHDPQASVIASNIRSIPLHRRLHFKDPRSIHQARSHLELLPSSAESIATNNQVGSLGRHHKVERVKAEVSVVAST